ncbi:MAG: 5'/3'-nucleotidase SurE [Candidatus Pacebacteria bacterium]|nr:5'/3'-nucleotidase SurE [Candidatus Paceibacterota bacterium]
MKINNILIVGDDGYNSIGTRLLVHLLKDRFNLKIAATKDQQSGVGGKLTLVREVKWGREEVDGVEAIWVNGTPVDAIELARNYFKEKFDLVISGMNLGANATNGIISSGTFAVAFRSFALDMAPNILVLSWNCPDDFWCRQGDENDEFRKFLEYPGKACEKIIDVAVENDFWGSDMLNVNFPIQNSSKAVFTRIITKIPDFYDSSIEINEETHSYVHPYGIVESKGDLNLDGDAIRAGYISITPCRTDFLNDKVYEKLKGESFEI